MASLRIFCTNKMICQPFRRDCIVSIDSPALYKGANVNA
ncbi:hypothetical protein Mal15_18950 [Stieleria maiorica]|uniref:Uncharacterized protein n=1 Tax=Stieleria maiorica TaxID=2795974 RepID=A0A5B9MBE0_9BACT|nr:hypothetical protein Mal15_18950 [Stieleria maiorica]